MKTIRLKMPIRVGKEIFPNNAVFDTDDAVADALLAGKNGQPCAEETDAIERYPIGNPLHHVDDFPVTGQEKFPLPEGHESAATPAMFSNHADRLVEKQIKNAAPSPGRLSKEPVAAKVDVTTEMEKTRAETDAAAKAPVADPVTGVVSPAGPVAAVVPAAPVVPVPAAPTAKAIP